MTDSTPHTERLIAAQKFLDRFAKPAPSPDPVEVGKETLAFLAELGATRGTATNSNPGAAEIGAGAAAPVNGEGGAAPAPAVPQTLKPEKIASDLLGHVHDAASAKAAVHVAEAQGATFVPGANGATALRLKDGKILPLSEALDAFGLGALKPPKGAKGSGGRGGEPVLPRERSAAVGILDRFAASGHDARFYAEHRDEILRARYGRLPLGEIKR